MTYKQARAYLGLKDTDQINEVAIRDWKKVIEQKLNGYGLPRYDYINLKVTRDALEAILKGE